MKTTVHVQGDKFLINGKLTYSEIEESNPKAHGLLMNARFIQGIFDDKSNPERWARFGVDQWDPDKNTADLIQALPEWYRYGLRAFTVGFQGGGPCFTIANETIHNSPYTPDGKSVNQDALRRMKSLITSADELGMVVIVSLFYPGQIHWLNDDQAVRNAVEFIASWLKEEQFTNVIIEIANERDCTEYKEFPILYTSEGMCELIALAREKSGGMLVGCSSLGFTYDAAVAAASDVNLLHSNTLTRQRLYNKIQEAKKISIPIVINEDSQALSQLQVTFAEGVSWGYYNNMTKQEPPAKWGVLKGEDLFFAYRMSEGIGIKLPPIPESEQYYLQGLEPEMTAGGKRWIRLASLYPEKIDHVNFYKNDKLIYVAYDDPFMVGFISNWRQHGTEDSIGARWKAEIILVSGEKRICEQTT